MVCADCRVFPGTPVCGSCRAVCRITGFLRSGHLKDQEKRVVEVLRVAAGELADLVESSVPAFRAAEALLAQEGTQGRTSGPPDAPTAPKKAGEGSEYTEESSEEEQVSVEVEDAEEPAGAGDKDTHTHTHTQTHTHTHTRTHTHTQTHPHPHTPTPPHPHTPHPPPHPHTPTPPHPHTPTHPPTPTHPHTHTHHPHTHTPTPPHPHTPTPPHPHTPTHPHTHTPTHPHTHTPTHPHTHTPTHPHTHTPTHPHTHTPTHPHTHTHTFSRLSPPPRSHTTLSHIAHTQLSKYTTPSHRPSFCVAGVALRHWAGSGDALGSGWSTVTPQSFVWQAWRLVTSTVTLCGGRGTWWHRPSLCVAGVALGDIDLHFVWQAWHLWHWAGSGDALGRGWSAMTPRSFVWQSWHLVTSAALSYAPL